MFDLSIKIFDLSKVFGTPDTFLKSKNYCTTFFIDWKPESKLLLPNVVFFACLEAFINWKVAGEIPCWARGDWDFRAVMGAQVSCDVSTFRLPIRNQRKQQKANSCVGRFGSWRRCLISVSPCTPLSCSHHAIKKANFWCHLQVAFWWLVHCCIKCPQILREKTSSEKYTVFSP